MGPSFKYQISHYHFVDDTLFSARQLGIEAPSIFYLQIQKQKEMVLTNFEGAGVGLGFGVGCGFGVGWGFGGVPLNVLGLGAGGGCGVGLGLGWGFGSAFGCHYRSSGVTFQGIEFHTKEETAGGDSKDLRKSTREVRASQ